jgi:death on curing protein
VEYLHDQGIAVAWPGIEPVGIRECRDRGLLESAVNLPFQSAFGYECYVSIHQKAACLFHSLIANHPFSNGNKRTAVLALDLFLLSNNHFLSISNKSMYNLSIETASYREKRIKPAIMMQKIVSMVRAYAVPFEKMGRKDDRKQFVMAMKLSRQHIRNDDRNRPGFPMAQFKNGF